MEDYIEVNGVRYVSETSKNYTQKNGLDYVIVRSSDSGCHAGWLEDVDKSTVTLVDARRLWYWSGAASLSELAMKGVAKPDECKFPIEVERIVVLGCCEIIDVTNTARESIAAVPVWSAS